MAVGEHFYALSYVRKVGRVAYHGRYGSSRETAYMYTIE
jgi:hypothetical protein